PEGLDGVRLPMSAYKKVLLAAHSTIVDVDTDPTVKEYMDALNALPDKELEFVRMSDYLAERAKKLDAEHKQGDSDAGIRRDRWIGVETKNSNRTILEVAGVKNPNPEVVKAEEFQEKSAESGPWNRTVATEQRFGSLEGDRTADVVVVGGGVVGLQTAYELGSHGLSTVVLDKGLVGSGTSRMMGAMGTYVEDSGFTGIYDAHGPEGCNKRLRALMQSRQSVQELAKQHGADWRDVDSFNISYDANDAALKEEVDLLHRFGDNSPRFVTGSDASKIF